MKTVKTILLGMAFLAIAFEVSAQASPCTSNTPTFTVDLTGQPFGSFNIGPIERNGLCCDAVSPDICLMVTITLDPRAVGFRFDITSGAVPPGSMFYQVGCGDPVKVGDIICLEGVGPHVLTFCKPGNNSNMYKISSVPMSIVPDSVHVNVGCSVEIGTLGYFIDSTLVWHDLTSTDGRYLDYLDCIKGCDTVYVTPDYNAPAYIDYEVCGNLVDTVCQDTDSYLCRHVRVHVHAIEETVDASTCANVPYTLPDGRKVDSAGTHVSILNSSEGCDSIVYTNLTIYPIYAETRTMTQCDSAIIHGKWYDKSQTVVDHFQSIRGCDSIITTELTIHYSKLTYQKQEVCDSGQVNGNWYFFSQIVRDTFQSYQSCDSVVLTDLTVHYTKRVQLSLTSCDSAIVNGNWYYSSQMVIDSFVSAEGCDSVEFTDLSINYTVRVFDSMTTCDNALINGKWYYKPQTVRDTFKTTKGCDSIIITELITHYSVQINLDETQCDSALINGNWHYSTKIVRDSFQTIYGCDSVIVTELVIHNSIITYANDVQCDSALINGNWYLSSQSVHDSFQTSKGCDSLHITYLSVVFPSTAVEQHTICERDSFNLPDGRIVYDPGNYRSIITNASGCDSTVYTSVLMNYTYYEPMPDTSKCLGDEITVYAGSGVDLVEYNWSDGSSGPSVVTTDIIKYQLKVTATNGCTAYDTIRVKDADCEACPVFIPTAFTPDNTGLNDDFHPVYECEFLDYRFEIFNRWGECLFHTRDPNVVWDGMYKDKAVPQDVYVWVVYYTDTRSLKPILHSGTVTLLR